MKANELVEGAIGKLLAFVSRGSTDAQPLWFSKTESDVLSTPEFNFLPSHLFLWPNEPKRPISSSPASSITCHVTATSKTGTS